jgi:hypothetical protein
MFEVLFTSNKYHSKAKSIFKDLFPTVNGVFEEIKKTNKEDLPILLQQIESFIFLKILTKKLAKKYPNMPLFTIHDSIVTTTKYCETVKNFMHEELTKLIGIPPILKVDYWDQNNLNAKIQKYEKILENKFQLAA